MRRRVRNLLLVLPATLLVGLFAVEAWSISGEQPAGLESRGAAHGREGTAGGTTAQVTVVTEVCGPEINLGCGVLVRVYATVAKESASDPEGKASGDPGSGRALFFDQFVAGDCPAVLDVEGDCNAGEVDIDGRFAELTDWALSRLEDLILFPVFPATSPFEGDATSIGVKEMKNFATQFGTCSDGSPAVQQSFEAAISLQK